jgi:hypothetical protein
MEKRLSRPDRPRPTELVESSADDAARRLELTFHEYGFIPLFVVYPPSRHVRAKLHVFIDGQPTSLRGRSTTAPDEDARTFVTSWTSGR